MWGLRDVERKMLAEKAQQDDASAALATRDDATEQVVLDYCAAMRGILNDDQGGPLHTPGVRMTEAIGEVRASIDRATATAGDKKGALVNGRSSPWPVA